MSKPSSGNAPNPPQLFAVENQGEFMVLRFGRHLAEHMTDLSETERLWEFFKGDGTGSRKVLLLTAATDSLSPTSLDAFWEHVCCKHAEEGRLRAASSVNLGVVREEHAFKHFVEGVRQSDSFIIATMRGECDFSFLGMALACDYRIASDDAIFVNRLFRSKATAGVLPWFLSRFLGHAEAADILLEGRSLTASEAFDLRLVNKLVPADRLEQIAMDTARRFSGIPAPALRALKRGLVASTEGLMSYLEQIGAGFQRVRNSPHSSRW